MRYFSALIKPASSLCNMRCRYCFYYDVASHRQEPSFGLMTAETAHCLINRIFDHLTPHATIEFTFQGGEPTLAGLDFYQDFLSYATSQNQGRFQLHYGIQTNGFILDEVWCQFFKEHHFLVGLSLDGYGENHDYYRLDQTLQGTHRQIQNAAKLLKKHLVDFNVVSVVTANLARHPQKVFRYYQSQGFRNLQLIPCLSPLEAEDIPENQLTPRAYGAFLKQLFDLWYRALTVEHRYVSIRFFDNVLQMLRGEHPELCGMIGRCSVNFVVESNGAVYPCDFYVLDEYCCGNVMTHTVEALSKAPPLQKFLQDRSPLPSLCSECDVFQWCGGGCSRYRSFYGQVDGYCPHQDFFRYTQSRFLQLLSPPQ